MKVKTLQVNVKKPFNFNSLCSAERVLFYPWSYHDEVLTCIERLHPGKILKLDISQENETTITLKVLGKSIDERDEEEIIKRVSWHLGVNEDLTEFYSLGRRDQILNWAIQDLYGARLVCGQPFEDAVCIICAQNTTLKQATKMVENLTKRLGDELKIYGESYQAFPTPEKMADTSLDELKECKLGYRANYVKNLAEKICAEEFAFESIKNLPIEKAREKLLKLKGMGPFTSEVILLYSFRNYKAFFIDVVVRKTIQAFYFLGKFVSDEEIKKFFKRKFGRYQGLALFYILQDSNNIAKRLNTDLRNPLHELVR